MSLETSSETWRELKPVKILKSLLGMFPGVSKASTAGTLVVVRHRVEAACCTEILG